MDFHSEFIEIKLPTLGTPIFIPNESGSLNQFLQVYQEITNPFGFHFYESYGTTIEADDIVVDCGAAEGLFSAFAAERCDKVYAIEPLPCFRKSLEKTFSRSRNVSLIHVALSDCDGVAKMTDKGISSHISASGEHEVGLAKLDTLFYENDIPITYIKADLEGFEMKMLRGARRTISNYKPKIAITTYHHEHDAPEIRDLLLTCNPRYHIRTKGVGISDDCIYPLMLHAW